MTARAPLAHGDSGARFTSLLRHHSAQVEQRWRRDLLTGHCGVNLRTNFVALATNGRTEVDLRFTDIAAE